MATEMTASAAELVEQAVQELLVLLRESAEVDVAALMDAMVDRVGDRQIASLAIWRLLDRGELVSSPGRRSDLLRAG